ncbi:MAG: hypothetical protein U1F43_02295 [Myxococcota bacterium]
MTPALVPRVEPLAPEAAVGRGAVARALVQAALELADERRARLEGVAGADLIVLLGPSDALPWVDGVEYLGREPLCPELYLPTTLAPPFATTLLARAAVARAGSTPVALLTEPSLLVPLGHARRLSAAALEAWRQAR